MSFFSRLEQLIKDKGTNFAELERNVGLGKGTIANWKIGNPTYDKLIKVVNFLDADILWLMEDDLKTSYTATKVQNKKSNSLNNLDILKKYDGLDDNVKKAIDLIVFELVEKNTEEEKRILSLFNSLGEREKNQIIGMLEIKSQECNDKKIKSSLSKNDTENIA